MSILFEPITIGGKPRPNRIFMSPMTRGRATVDGVPTEIMREYYQLRAAAGLIITEACAISPQGYGWPGSPGIWTEQQAAEWRTITDVVKQQGGSMFLQLWHMGRCSHPDFLNGESPVAPSAIVAKGETYTPTGKVPYVAPKALTHDQIDATIADYTTAAKRALDAGFDGVELHGGGGYLIDQFIRDGSNKRTDKYGGSLENRLRFLRELLDTVCSAVGGEYVGVRFAPKVTYNDMADSDPQQTFGRAAEILNDYDIAFLDIMEGLPGKSFISEPGPAVTPVIRNQFNGLLIANGGYDGEIAVHTIDNGEADAVAFGVPFIANPDYVERLRLGAPLQVSDPQYWYVGGETGFVDFPLFDGDMTARQEKQVELKPTQLNN